jgi:hypothetical protein
VVDLAEECWFLAGSSAQPIRFDVGWNAYEDPSLTHPLNSSLHPIQTPIYTMNIKTHFRSLFLPLCGFIALLASPQVSATLAVTNGNFSDLTGLTDLGGSWYSGVPTGWFLSSGDTPGYSVVQNGAAYYANLQTLSNGSPNLRQNIGTLSTAADITVTFKTRSLTSIAGSIGSAIYNAADDSPLAVFSTPSRITGDTSVTYTARGVAAGTAVYVSFWSFVPEAAPGITDVAVSVAAAPTTLTLHSDSVTQLDAALPTRTDYQMVFEPGAKVSVTGTPSGDAVLLLASTGSISGAPVLDPPVAGYTLATTGKRLWLYAAGSPSLAVFNGDFSNLSGLTDNGGGWYGGVPADWNSPYTNPAYTVTGTTANLQTLSFTSNPLYQNVGTTDSVTTITLSFEVLQLQTNAPTVTVAIYDSTGAPSSGTVLATGTYSTGSHTLVASDVPANTPITVAFSENTVGGFAGGLDNVSVAVSPAGATFSAWQSANGTTGTLDEDHDDDGVSNGIEYFLGGSTLPDANTTGFTVLPSVTPGSPLTVTWTKAASYTGNYDTHFRVETSETLSGAWSPVSEGVGTDTVQISDNNITYTFPTGAAKKFARLVVTGP